MKIVNMDKLLEELGFPEYEIQVHYNKNMYSEPMLVISHPSKVLLKKLIDEIFEKLSKLEYLDFVSECDKPSILVIQAEFEDYLVSKYMEAVQNGKIKYQQ